MSTCPSCGRSHPKDVHFCAGCGTRLPPGVSPERSESPGLEGLRAVVNRLVADRLSDPERAPRTPAPHAPAPHAPAIVDPAQKSHGRLTFIRTDGSDGQAYPLVGEQIDIGRTEGALTFDDPHLAPRHARITLGPTGYVLKDLSTRNGVYHRLRGPIDLEDGDHILIGKQVLQFGVVAEYERVLGPSVDTGTVLFGTPVVPAWGRLVQITPGGVACDILHISRPEVVLGREQSDIVFSDDEFMSRRHAQLSFRQGRARLEDLGSSNGTFCRLRGPYPLAPGDFIRLGDELLRFDL